MGEPLSPLPSASGTPGPWRVFNLARPVFDEGVIKSAVLAGAMQSPAAFWTTIFAGATHNSYLLGGHDPTGREKTLRLSYKTHAITALNSEIQSLEGPASDELLLAIITLATHGSDEHVNSPTEEASLSPLASVHNFQYYSGMDWEEAHLKAVVHLVYQKGGLHSIKMPGLANAIGLADIFCAFRDLRTPSFPLLASTSLILSTWPDMSVPLPLSLSHLATAFDEYRHIDGLEPLLPVVETIRLITTGFAQHLAGQSEAPSLNQIVSARNFMTHDLLSLQPASDPVSSPHSTSSSSASTPPMASSPISSHQPQTQAIYSLISLSLLTYNLLVLFPLPRSTNLHVRLSRNLMLAVKDCTNLNLWRSHGKLLLWSTVLGGILCEETGLRDWFVEMARQARTRVSNLVPGIEQASSSAKSASDIGTKAKGKAKATTKTTVSKPKAGRRDSGPSQLEAEQSPQKQSDTTWPAVRAICTRFLWFDSPECEGAGHLYWKQTYGETD
jgi:hypothetical protein